MKKCLVAMASLALVAVLATGCGEVPSPAPSLAPAGEEVPLPAPPSAPAGEEVPLPAPPSAPAGEEINFRFLISDEENAIGDFTQLWIEISEIGLQGSESGGWIPVYLEPPESVDLVPVQDENAQLIWSGYLEPGVYHTVFIHVTDIRWELKPGVDGVTTGQESGGPGIRVKLPSEKLQIHFNEPFEVFADTQTDFVYDVTVIKAGKSGQYIIKPQLNQSGTAQPFNEVQATGDLEITTASLPDGVIGEEYEAELEAAGGIEPYTWSISDGVLPVGLELDPDDGEISGTPDAGSEGDYAFTVQVEDDSAQTDIQEFTISIAAAAELEITTASLPDGVVGEEYEAEVEAAGGIEPYTWSIFEGVLPEGMELDPDDGEITGTPEAGSEGDYTFTVQVEDDSDPVQTDIQEFTISITAAAELEITTASLPDGVVGEEYEAEVEAAGGIGPYTWSISDGVLPEGLELDPNDGEITGTPEAASEGGYTFTVQVEDSSEPALSTTEGFSILIEGPTEGGGS